MSSQQQLPTGDGRSGMQSQQQNWQRRWQATAAATAALAAAAAAHCQQQQQQQQQQQRQRQNWQQQQRRIASSSGSGSSSSSSGALPAAAASAAPDDQGVALRDADGVLVHQLVDLGGHRPAGRRQHSGAVQRGGTAGQHACQAVAHQLVVLLRPHSCTPRAVHRAVPGWRHWGQVLAT